MLKNKTVIAATASVCVVLAAVLIFTVRMSILSYGKSQFLAGTLEAEKKCEQQKEDAVQEAIHNRKENDIRARRLSMDDVVRLLSDRGELRD